jgi:hypothetical protein
VAPHAWSPPNFPHSEEETKWWNSPCCKFNCSRIDRPVALLFITRV